MLPYGMSPVSGGYQLAGNSTTHELVAHPPQANLVPLPTMHAILTRGLAIISQMDNRSVQNRTNLYVLRDVNG